MSTNLSVLNNVTNLPAYLTDKQDDLSDSFSMGGAVRRLSVKNGQLVIRAGGQESQPMQMIEVVLIDVAPRNDTTYRQYYKGTYSVDNVAAPVCFSEDGIKPHPMSSEIQAKTCAECPRNVKGKSATGGRECGFSKHLVVAPIDNMHDLYQVRLSATTIFDTKHSNDPNAGLGYRQYGNWFREFSNQIKAKFNKDIPIQALTVNIGLFLGSTFGYAFKPGRFLTEEENATRLEIINTRQADIQRALSNVVTNVDHEETTAEAPAAPAAPVPPAPPAAEVPQKDRWAADARLPEEVRAWLANPAVTEQAAKDYLQANYPHILA